MSITAKTADTTIAGLIRRGCGLSDSAAVADLVAAETGAGLVSATTVSAACRFG